MNNQVKVIVYDDKNIKYLTGYMEDCKYEPVCVENTRLDESNACNIQYPPKRSFDIIDINESDTIKLDETLMRRIAKYNKEKECQQLDEKIKKKKAKIKELDDILTDKVGRVEKLKEFIAKIYDIDLYNGEDDFDDDWD